MTDQSNTPRPPVCTRAIARQATSAVAFRGEALDPDDPLLGFKPVPHKAPRRNSITPARQRAFIAMLAASGIVSHAARHIGASMEALYKLRNKAEERLVVSGGKVLGTETRYNENLVMFFLRSRRGERYAADYRNLRPGHPLYDRIAAEAVARYKNEDEAADEQAIFESIDQFLEDMRQRRLANERIMREGEEPEENGAE